MRLSTKLAALAVLFGAVSTSAFGSSLIATGEIRMCCGSSGEDPQQFDLQIELARYEDPYANPVSSTQIFTFNDLETLGVGASQELTSGSSFDAAVAFFTNGVGYGETVQDRIDSVMDFPGSSRTTGASESYLFGLGDNSLDLAGKTIDKIEVVITYLTFDRDYVSSFGTEGFRFDVRYQMNVYGSEVPIPAAGWLMLSGLGFLAARRRRS